MMLDALFAESEVIKGVEEFCTVPGGSYLIGQVSGVDSDEEPRHVVNLDEYRVSSKLVTNTQFQRFAPSFAPDDISSESNFPVVNVTWFEAQLYCRWAFPRSGRLPTEAEWGRWLVGAAATKRCYPEYPWGDSPDHDRGNFARSRKGPTAVTQFPPNKFGMFDASGNVFEWCHDWYEHEYYKRSPNRDPGGPKTGRWKVMRGGCWAREAEVARCSYRVRRDSLNARRSCRLPGLAVRIKVKRER